MRTATPPSGGPGSAGRRRVASERRTRSPCTGAERVISEFDEEVPVVAEWRRRVRGEPWSREGTGSRIGPGWFPIPARLDGTAGTHNCILSWSPSASPYSSLDQALRSNRSDREPVDRTNQARYYLGWVLARLHGVSFGSGDAIEDASFERTEEVRELSEAYFEQETSRIVEARRGRLDRLG